MSMAIGVNRCRRRRRKETSSSQIATKSQNRQKTNFIPPFTGCQLGISTATSTPQWSSFSVDLVCCCAICDKTNPFRSHYDHHTYSTCTGLSWIGLGVSWCVSRKLPFYFVFSLPDRHFGLIIKCFSFRSRIAMSSRCQNRCRWVYSMVVAGAFGTHVCECCDQFEVRIWKSFLK